MKKYLIDTTNSTEPFEVETEEDLIDEFNNMMLRGYPTMKIKHKKDLIDLGTYKYEMILNVNQIVSITTSEKA